MSAQLTTEHLEKYGKSTACNCEKRLLRHNLPLEQAMTDLRKTVLSTSHKVDLAVLSLATQGDYGSVSTLSRKFEVSRPTVYDVRQTASDVLERHFDSPLASTGAQHAVVVDEAQLRRAIVALRAQAPNSIRDIEGLLPLLYPGLTASYGFIQAICAEAEARAREFNEHSDLSRIRAGAVDEMYSQGKPVLGGVDLDSGYLFLLALRDGRSAEDWAEELRACKARGLDLEIAVKDAASGIRLGVTEVFPAAEQRDDCFHALYEMGKVSRLLEQRAYGSLDALEKAGLKVNNCRQSGQGDRRHLDALFRGASRKVNTALELHDRFESAKRRAQEAMEVVNRETGTLRSAELMKYEITAAALEMLALDHKKCQKVGRYLKNRADGLVLHARELGTALEEVASVFGQPSVELSCLIMRLLSELEAGTHFYRRFESRRQLRAAYQQLQDVAGDQCGQVLAEVEFWLWHRHRASSAIEGFNAALRPYLYVHKGVTPGFLELFRVYYNLRYRRWGRQKGTSPHQILTGEVVGDWLTLLGYPTSSQFN